MTHTILNAFAFWRPVAGGVIRQESDQLREEDKVAILFRSLIVGTVTVTAIVKLLTPSRAMILRRDFAPLAIPFLGLIFTVVWGAWANFEVSRVRALFDCEAIKSFKSASNLVPSETMAYLSQSPSVVSQLLTECNHQKIHKNINKDSQSLLEKVLHEASSLYRCTLPDEIVKMRQLLSVFKLLLDANIPLARGTHNSFVSAMGITNNPEFAIYALEKGKIKPEDLTSKQQFECWKNVTDQKLARLLVEKGFNVNVTLEGVTPLQSRIQECGSPSFDFGNIRLLLDHGAVIPRSVQVKEQTVELYQFLADKPLLQRTLTQAGNHPSGTAKNVLEERRASLFPFSTPLIDVERYTMAVSGSAIFGRTELVAMAVVATAMALKSASLFVTVPLALLSLGFYNKFEWSRAVKALNAIAKKEFQNMFPADSAVKYVVSHEDALDELIAQKADLSKESAFGLSLWSKICSQHCDYELRNLSFESRLSIFKKLAHALFKNSNVNKYAYFLEAVKSGQPEYVEYLLQSGKISKADFTPQQTFDCWIAIANNETAKLLQAEFDVNVQNDKGQSVLDYVISYQHLVPAKFERYDHVKALLAAGATVTDAIRESAKDDEAITMLLNERRS